MGHMACGILVPAQGSNPCPLQLKRRVLTTEPPRKSPVLGILNEGNQGEGRGQKFQILFLLTNKSPSDSITIKPE